MRTMAVAASVVWLVASPLACSKKAKKNTGEAKPADAVPADVRRARELATQMCACADKPCADKLQKEFTAFTATVKASDTTQKAHQAASKQLMDCYMTLAKGGVATVDAGVAKPPETKTSAVTAADAMTAVPKSVTGGQRVSAAQEAALLGELGGLVEAMCKCADMECAKQVAGRLRDWGKRNVHINPSPDAQRKGDVLHKRFSACLRGLSGGVSTTAVAINEAIADVKTIAAEVCKCKGPTCRREASTKLIRWRTKYAKIRPGQDGMKVIMQLQKKMAACLKNAAKPGGK